MEDINWDFFCNNSPRLISKDRVQTPKLNPKLQGILSKINLAYTDKQPSKLSTQPLPSSLKIKAKSLSRPIKKACPSIPRMLFSREDILSHLPSHKTPLRSKSPNKKISYK